MPLSRAEKPRSAVDWRRRKFLSQFCYAAGACLIPNGLWQVPRSAFAAAIDTPAGSDPEFALHPHYRNARPLDTTLAKVKAGSDEFVSEKYADQIDSVLAEWSASLIRAANDTRAFEKSLAENFSGFSLQPLESRPVRSGIVRVTKRAFSNQASIGRDAFVQSWRSGLNGFSRILTAEFQVTRLEASEATVVHPSSTQHPDRLKTQVRYEIVGEGAGFHREQRTGYWEIVWEPASSSAFRVTRWKPLEETCAVSTSPVYAEITAAALGSNSYTDQLLHGTDYWRTIIDGAAGIDVYGHNGVSVADVDSDGYDDLYVCQPAGLPNRLFRNRGDGTFEDITEYSGLGVLENTTCAIFADFHNAGRQDVIVVRANGPLLFVNEGGGKFREKPDAFQFANPPQGAFTGASAADYDRDGWLDIYFCLYNYYQGTGQYRYPSPYHDAENGPPNFLMRNQRDGTFRDVTRQSGLNQNNTRYSFCCGWSDYNRDGWPDLYVVNDFGRKNLYRNNGDGTFSDVAGQAGVEDVGAGMSVCWADFDGDGSEDLYVANMWTAAGMRISAQDIFKTNSPEPLRALYRKHAMGNSLFRNHGASFEDATPTSGTGMGRWAWSSDAFDFDHDGFADLYVTNGMVSGPSREDLNSFFWRQVVSRSPDEAAASPDYEQGWNAINELIRSDGTWSGYERNVFYANNRDGTFSDVSGALELDFVEDGRAFALGDFDHDGRLEIVLKNRSAPQLRLLRNVAADLPASISFRLQGTKSNRDAIGAVVTIEGSAGRQTRTLQAGSAFLSQHSKDIFFGLGESKSLARATIRWPSGVIQELQELPVNHRIWVVEGSDAPRVEAFRRATVNPAASSVSLAAGETLPERVETWLLAPVPAPEFSLADLSGKICTLASLRGKPLLLNFCNIPLPESREELKALHELRGKWASSGLQVFAVHVGEDGSTEALRQFAVAQHISVPILVATEDAAAIYNILFRQLFDRHRDLPLTTSFLIDEAGSIVKVYQGRLDAGHAAQDFRNIPETDAERLALALPFPSRGFSLDPGRNYLSLGALFFQRGYLDQAEASFQQALRDDPASAEALYGIGSVYLNQNKNAEAREVFERTVKLQASFPGTLPDAWNNLGVIATREGRVGDSVEYFQRVLGLNGRHVLSLENLGNAYRLQKKWDEAQKYLQRALELAPQDAEVNYSLGMVYAQTGENAKAYEYLQRALKARPDYPEALNNLGILYLVTKRRDDAVASFQQCIRVAPSFDQAYMNLARVYALEGARDQARAVLQDLLKQHPDHAGAKQMLEQLQ
ncbi:MAG TPA: FG-GAP-like repeat-containing protein [Candidatus Solibacter sp.]|nr:FG-GAP-like repeat-containing protein [Candidatus Solibacter sp.]